MPRTWAFTQRRKMLRLQAVSRQRQWIAFLVGMILLLPLIAWLYSGKTHVWIAKPASSKSWILTQALPEVLAAIAILVVLALWLLPKRQAARSQGLTAGNRFDRENEARKTLAQIIGGVLVLAGLYSSLQTFSLQQRTFELQQQGQITDRFTKAIDQLGAVETGPDGKPKINLEVRLGGIYALERIARDSPTDHWTIIEVLSTYVGENSPRTNYAGEFTTSHRFLRTINLPAKAGMRRLRADIQAILTVIGRREITHDPPNRHVNLSDADLLYADLHGAHLEGADLDGSNLILAHLTGAHLKGATLTLTHLEGADLDGADLRGVDFSMSNLEGAELHGANLDGAELGETNLEGAELGETNLTGADLRGADLEEARIEGVDLSKASGIDQNQLDKARGDKNTKLPVRGGLSRPQYWH